MAMIKQGYRSFDGKKYHFWMFADTKKEAEARVKDGHKHFLRFNETSFFRVTDIVAPKWNPTPSGRRFVIWVRTESVKTSHR